MDMYDWKHRILRVVPLFLAGIMASSFLSSDKNKLPELDSEIINTVYDTGAHVVLKVERLGARLRTNQRFALENINGYRIIDFDYDRYGGSQFHDTVYANDREMCVSVADNFGKPTTDEEKNDLDAFKHVIVDISRASSLCGKDSVSFALDAPVGYDVIDYDYDNTRISEYETITYRNNVEVTCEDRDDFGNPVGEVIVNEHSDGCYDVGEHRIVTIKKEVNPWYENEEMKQVIAPKGYRIIDYDYDKSNFSGHETIVYENVVPVYCVYKSQFGTPINPVNDNLDCISEYEPFTHVLVKIVRNQNKKSLYSGTREFVAPDGYELLDYDYDINEDFEFETYVYINNKKIYLDDTTNFGSVLGQDSVKKKILVL